MIGDIDLKTSVLSDGDIVSCDAELINFDWLKMLNNGVRPKIFIAVDSRQGQPKVGCMHAVSIAELKAILEEIELNIAVKKNAKR